MKPFEIGFSNRRNISFDTLSLMVRRLEDINNEDYFLEWSKLVINPIELPVLDLESYKVKFQFEASERKPTRVMLMDGFHKRMLGDWDANLELNLSKSDLSNLLQGKSSIYLLGDEQKEVKKKTYRVFFHDGKESKIYYVSHELTFPEFIAEININSTKELPLQDIFTYLNSDDSSEWWMRKINSQDYTLVKSPRKDLRNEYLKLFLKSDHEIYRENGVPQNRIIINKKKDSKLLLKVRPLRNLRNFIITSNTKTITTGGGRDGVLRENCSSHTRSIEIVPIKDSSLLDFAGQIEIKTESGDILLPYTEKAKIEQYEDKKGIYWLINLSLPVMSIEIKFTTDTQSTNEITGIFSTNCPHHFAISDILSNSEANFRLEIEAYVEKLY